MPRRARLVMPGVPLHLIQRGNNRSACFYSEEDYLFYLEHLAEQARKQACEIHAWCLMTNHVHLLLTPSNPIGASLLMKGLGQRYVQYVNRTYQRTGTLWEGRFRSCLVQEDSYVLACYRYIEMNPVRAGIVEHPAEYRWTSYRANAQGEESRVITPSELLPEGSGATYGQIRDALRSCGGDRAMEHASYRIMSDGAFVHRSLENASATYHFRSPEPVDDELPYAILWKFFNNQGG